MKERRVFTDEDVFEYAKNRLTGKNLKLEDITEIELWQGFLPRELHHELQIGQGFLPPGKDGEDIIPTYDLVEQDNPREPIFHHDGKIMIPEFSSIDRAKRYKVMITSMIAASPDLNDIRFRVVYPEGKKRIVEQQYSNFAYDFTMGLFLPEERHLTQRIFDSHNVRDIKDIIVGPLESVAAYSDEVIASAKNEYLDVQLVKIGDVRALNIGYIYGRQASILFDKIFKEIDGFHDEKNQTDINVYMYGRVGSLFREYERHDVLTPTATIDELDVRAGTNYIHPFTNILARRGKECINLNVLNVIDETYELLESAKNVIGYAMRTASIDMEIKHALAAIDDARGKYYPHLRINFGFVGHVSDRPLYGDKLSVELDSKQGEQAAAKMIADHIRSQE
ncbi:hypothetical protein H6503_05080 [Candidatus Woesearchaeota archaeon]|nr:hypothetical protein [Candidatus Woesearchaeota archaeon]